MVIASTAFFLLVCFGIPLGALLMFLVRDRRLAAVFALGAACFFVSQVVLRLPLLSALGGTAWFVAFAAVNPFLYLLGLAASAALFEETARYVMLRSQRKNAFDLRIPIAFGLGHGGLEALLTGVGAMPTLLANFGQVDLLGGALFVSGLERLSAMACHIAFTLLVYYAVLRRRPAVFGCALLLHCFVDVCAGLASYSVFPLFLFEIGLAVFAILQLWLVYSFVDKRKEPS